jgi:hypothetical protein
VEADVKGFLFTELLDFADRELGPDAVARLRTRDGERATERYHAAGNYEHTELLDLADQLAASAGTTRADLLRRFGRALFGHFAAMYPAFVAGTESALTFLANLEPYVHRELQELYVDAQFPVLECTWLDGGWLRMIYRSRRRLADLAEGLIEGCIAHFGEAIGVRREDLPAEDGQAVCFELMEASRPGTD